MSASVNYGKMSPHFLVHPCNLPTSAFLSLHCLLQFLVKEKESQDLLVSVTEFEKQQPSKMDPFASYKIKTEVCMCSMLSHMGPEAS